MYPFCEKSFLQMSLYTILKDQFQVILLHHKQQQTAHLIGPRTYIESDSIEPESLLKLLEKRYRVFTH